MVMVMVRMPLDFFRGFMAIPMHSPTFACHRRPAPAFRQRHLVHRFTSQEILCRRGESAGDVEAHHGGGGHGGGGNGSNMHRVTWEGDEGNGWRNLQSGLTAVVRGWMLMACTRMVVNLPANSEETVKRMSIVIPTLNEETCIVSVIECLFALDPKPFEVIVVDGGSTDRTVRLASKAGAIVLKSGRGRGRQMNAGAKRAKGEYICFLHADTLPPQDLVKVVANTLRNPRVVLGGLRMEMKDESGRPVLAANLNSLFKTYYLPLIFRPFSLVRGLRVLFGDQALFCRRADFHHAGCFDEAYPILEDLGLCISMHNQGPLTGAKGRRGRIHLVMNRAARTSGRRVLKWGLLRTMHIYCVISLSWYWGSSPQRIQELYDKLYTDCYR